MKPSSCKSKGRRLQQQVARDVLTAFPHLDEDDVRSTPMGAHGEDVMLSARARACFPFSVEAKNVERLNIWSALEQNAKNARGNHTLIIFKRNRSQVYATIEWSVLLGILTSATGGEREATSPSLSEALEHVERASDILRRCTATVPPTNRTKDSTAPNLQESHRTGGSEDVGIIVAPKRSVMADTATGDD